MQTRGSKMSGKFLILCTVGLMGSLFVGYCVYFDQKRRRDPDYKKKVLAKRRASSRKAVTDLRDPKVKEEFLMNEMANGYNKLAEGKVEECIAHFINFVKFSGNPRATLMTLQQTLPPPLFSLLVRTFASMPTEGVPSSGAQKSEDTDVD